LTAVGYGVYRRIQTETSSPGELILMLYDALLNDLQHAESDLTQHHWEPAHTSLVRAQEIVLELIASLDMDAGEIARQLAPLYEYQYQRLLEANVQKNPKPVTEVIGLVRPLREAWMNAVRKVQAARA
jgi:flagellar protein FliS